MSEVFTQKWAVASFFDELPAGFEFHKSQTPLHTTIAGVFAIEKSGREIAELLHDCLANFTPIVITAGRPENWDGIQVTVLEKASGFNNLYNKVQNTLLENGAVFNEPQYLGAGFKPHVTKQPTSSLEEGKMETVKSVSLVDMFPHIDGNSRRITFTLDLAHHE